MSNSQLNKLKSGIKNSSEVTLNLSSNVIDDSNDESNCPCKLLLADRQTSKVHKSFENNFWANMKLSKTQLSKIVQSAGFLGRFLRPLRRAGSQLGNNVLIPVAKIVVISLGLMATADAAIQNKFLELGMTTLVISNKWIDNIVKIVKSLEEFGDDDDDDDDDDELFLWYGWPTKGI